MSCAQDWRAAALSRCRCLLPRGLTFASAPRFRSHARAPRARRARGVLTPPPRRTYGREGLRPHVVRVPPSRREGLRPHDAAPTPHSRRFGVSALTSLRHPKRHRPCSLRPPATRRRGSPAKTAGPSARLPDTGPVARGCGPRLEPRVPLRPATRECCGR